MGDEMRLRDSISLYRSTSVSSLDETNFTMAMVRRLREDS